MKIVVGADFVPVNRVENYIVNKENDFLFSDIKNVLIDVDYSILNLECPIVTSNSTKPISKLGICLKTNERAVDSLLYMGISAVTLANNHIMDYGKLGLSNTLDVLTSNGFDFFGAGNSLEEANKVFIKNTSVPLKFRTI